MDNRSWISVDIALQSDDPVEVEDPARFKPVKGLWPTWHREAKCLGIDDNEYFGASSPDERPAYTKTSIRKAQARCYQCPVFEQCLRHALGWHEEYGVWAATTRKQRAAIFRNIGDGSITMDQIVDILLKARETKRQWVK